MKKQYADNQNDHNTKPSVIISELNSAEEIEQVGKDIIVGHKYVSYEDSRNVISVIINAISIRINMPRGTVKALATCLVAFILAALVYASNALHLWTTNAPEAEPTTEVAEPATEEQSVSADDSESPDDVLALKDYVNISPHYYYHLPDGVADIWDPEDPYAENETFCDFTYEDDRYTVRSYVLEYEDAELASIVKAELSLFDNMEFIDEEYIDGKYGEILRIRFECLDEDGKPMVGTGYYWYESIPKICCLEVAADAWHDGKAEEMIKESIYRVSAGTTAPYTVDESAWSDTLKEDAMDSLAEDAMREYYEQKPDYTDRVLKP